MTYRSRRPRTDAESARLPAIVRIFLWAFVSRRDQRSVQSDLAELYMARRNRDGAPRARRWLMRHIAQYPLRIIAERLHRAGDAVSTPFLLADRGPKFTGGLLASLLQDLRYNIRSLSRAPVFTITIFLTVGLGIGGTTAVFSILNAVLIEPLQYAGADRMVRIYTDMGGGRDWGLSLADYLALDEQQTSFDGVAMLRYGTVTFNHDELAERIPIGNVTPNFFSLLGIAPLHGRLFTQDDAGERHVMIAHGLWTRHFGADLTAVGKSVRFNDQNYTVIGILPPEVGPLLEGREALGVMSLEPPPRKGPFGMFVVGRLKHSVERDVAAQELRAINERIFPLWKASWPDQESTWSMKDLKVALVGDIGRTLGVALGAVAFVLLIASTNAANLLVARGLQRRRELTVRAVLGGSRTRLLQHLLSESVLLAVGGGTLGFLFTLGAIQLITTLGAEFIPRSQEIGLTAPVAWFFVVISSASALLFGLVPAIQMSRPTLGDDLRASGNRNTASLGSRRLRRILVASQFAVTVPLLVGASLLISSLAKLGRVDPGFDPSQVLTLRVSLPSTVYADQSRRLAFWTDVTQRVRSLPGVTAAGLAAGRPPLEYGFGNNFVLEDRPAGPGEAQLSVPWMIVSPEYFNALGVSLITGRMFDARDGEDPFNVLVDQNWAKRFFGDEEAAVGRRFRHGACTGEGCPWATVVGVVNNVRYSGLDNPGEGQIYVSLRRWTNSSMFVVLRTTIDPLSVLPSVRATIRELDSTLPITQVATIPELMRDSLAEPRYLSILVTAFALVALVLSVVGIYGVMAYFVYQHTRDIGIRIALGGAPSSVRNLVLRNGMQMVVVGIVLGLGGAYVLSRFMANLLFEITSTDTVTFFGVSLGMLATALAACFIPARRAARTDPANSLRSE